MDARKAPHLNKKFQASFLRAASLTKSIGLLRYIPLIASGLRLN